MTKHPDKFEKTIESLRSLRWDANRTNAKIEAEIQKLPVQTRKPNVSFRRRTIACVVMLFVLVGSAYATGGLNIVRDYFFRGTIQGPDGKKTEIILRKIENGRFEGRSPDGTKRIFEKVDPAAPEKNKRNKNESNQSKKQSRIRNR